MANAPQLSPTSNALGLAGFITSIVGILSCGILSPIGMILSIIGLFKRPRGFAIAGTIIGLVGSLGIILVIFFVIGIAAMGAVFAGAGGFEIITDSLAIHSGIEAYQQQNASLPATLQQVTNLTSDQLKDPWGHEYIYRPDLVNHHYELISIGPDGAEGTGDDINIKRDVPFAGPAPSGNPSSPR